MHLRQPGFKYSTCGSFIENKGKIQNLKKEEIHDIFIKIVNMMDIKWVLLQLFIDFFYKRNLSWSN